MQYKKQPSKTKIKNGRVLRLFFYFLQKTNWPIARFVTKISAILKLSKKHYAHLSFYITQPGGLIKRAYCNDKQEYLLGSAFPIMQNDRHLIQQFWHFHINPFADNHTKRYNSLFLQ